MSWRLSIRPSFIRVMWLWSIQTWCAPRMVRLRMMTFETPPRKNPPPTMVPFLATPTMVLLEATRISLPLGEALSVPLTLITYGSPAVA
ncbi:hypothetical protein AB0L44_14720 [Nonomuraea wenchangensis]|uniref:hypothetical protein n=1 Tax=Nonomuraea wenchangensis TaxID=568860 RepID=UPI00342F0341